MHFISGLPRCGSTLLAAILSLLAAILRQNPRLRAGTPGLHDVRPTVAAIEPPTLLPPDLFRRFANDAFWGDPARQNAAVRLV
jgi:hypothetical protein